jgi:hypothetical protein
MQTKDSLAGNALADCSFLGLVPGYKTIGEIVQSSIDLALAEPHHE